jgi:hypothetical protein
VTWIDAIKPMRKRDLNVWRALKSAAAIEIGPTSVVLDFRKGDEILGALVLSTKSWAEEILSKSYGRPLTVEVRK